MSSLLQRIDPYSANPAHMEAHIEKGWIQIDKKRPTLDQVLVAGNTIDLVIPDTVEPSVGTRLTVLFEDDHIMVVDKPSPLPIHPCGRFNRNTLILLARLAWPDITLKPVHRLDANTTGVLVFAKTVPAARWLVTEFHEHRVEKTYVARVHGIPKQPSFTVTAAIEAAPSKAGTRKLHADGRQAITEIRLWRVLDDGTSVLYVEPKTGRTNQIRLHLNSAELPIVGDIAYGIAPDTTQGLTHEDRPLCLHAHKIQFRHPETQQAVAFHSEVPEHFELATEI